MLVDVDLGDDGNGAGGGGDSVDEVVNDEFLVGGVEAESGWKRRRVGHGAPRRLSLSLMGVKAGFIVAHFCPLVGDGV